MGQDEFESRRPPGSYLWPFIFYPHTREFSNVVHHKPNMTFLDDWKHCLCGGWPPILGHNRRLNCYGNWYDGGQTQPANLLEYTPEARPHPANSTAKKRQVAVAAPELFSEAGCRFCALCLTFEVAPEAVFGSQEPFFGLLPGSPLALASLWKRLQEPFWGT